MESPPSPAYVKALHDFGYSLIQRQAWPEAEATLRDCLTESEELQPDVWTTFNTRSLLGESLLGQKKYSEAESLLISGLEGLKTHQASIPEKELSRIRENVDRLIELYSALEQPEQVSKYEELRAQYPNRP